MTENLIEIAREFQLIDPDLLKLARTDIEPRQAVQDLKQRYPSAFKQQIDVRGMSKAEYAAHRAQFLRDVSADRIRRLNERDAARIAAKHGART